MAESDAPPPPVPPENGGAVAWLLAQYRRDPDFTGKAERTRRSYDDCAAWLREHFGDLPLAAVTPATVRVLKRAGASTPAQTNMRLRFLRLVWNWGRRNGCAGDNPAERMRQLCVRPRDVVWEAAEIARFMAEACPSMRLAVTLGLYSIQREGDLLAASWTAFEGARFERASSSRPRSTRCCARRST